MFRQLADLLDRYDMPIVAAIFALTALWLTTGPLPFRSPVPPPQEVSSQVIDPAPVRTTTMTPSFTLGNYTFNCNECHRSQPTPYVAGRGITRHDHIRLEHGINKRCLNCHHPSNRNAFVDDWGEEIPWSEPQLLCAKCHGPVYRDWQHGSHGRINGYWDTSKGPQVRLKCVRCHDPHHPRFQSLATAPPPHTLRATPETHHAHERAHNPLSVAGNAAAVPPVTARRESHE